MLHFKYILALIALMFLSVPANASERSQFVPWNFSQARDTKVAISPSAPDLSTPAYLLRHGVKFFMHYISRVDGDRCRMYPTCSHYSLQAIETHGFFIGIVMTADRLIHESNEMDYAPLVHIGNHIRYLDPVCNNDFWWYRTNDLDKRPTVTKLSK